MPSNPGWITGVSEVAQEQLSEAGTLAFAGMKFKAAATTIVLDAAPRFVRDPTEPCQLPQKPIDPVLI